MPYLLGAQSDPRAAGAAPGAAPGGGQERLLSPSGQVLVRATLPERIAAAGYFELLDELRVLGLDDRGTRAELAARLRGFYGLPAPPAAAGEPSEVVQVRQAGHAEYATSPDTGADSVALRGAVEVVVRKTDPDTVHVIRADEVIHDRTARLLTARGDVSYEVMQEGEEAQSVHAASMSFDLPSSKAVFVDATTRQQRRGESGPLTFTFDADAITRLTDGTIVLDNVRFSSSPDPIRPNYEVRARRMWLLAPGEWAMQSATLRVGRVPLFYLPYFVWPGDELVFHPALGVRDREGLFLNTTLYLIGRRERDADPFSVLSLTDPGKYREELRGMFLRKIRGVDPRSEEHYLKLMLDLYSRLGVFSGVAATLPVADAGEASFQVGAARSRSIFYLPAQGGYTAVDESGRSYWNDATLFGAAFPLRYGIELAGNARFRGSSLRARLEVFSDPDFVRDFGDREERIDWPGLLGFEGGRDGGPGRRSSLTWEVIGSADLNELLAGGERPPLLQRAQVTNAGVRWLWQSRADPAAPLHDPTRSFFYPATLRVPASAQVSGTFWRWPAPPASVPSAETPAPAAVAGRGLRGAAAPPAPADASEPAGDDSPPRATATAGRLPPARHDEYRAPPAAPVAAAALPQVDKSALRWELPRFRLIESDYHVPGAVTTLVHIRSDTGEVYIGDSALNTLTVLGADGRIKIAGQRPPTEVFPIDIEFIGGTAYVGSIGDLEARRPTEERAAHISTLDLVGDSIEAAPAAIIVPNLYRMADMEPADLNGDGRLDFVVCGFGHVTGRISWFESRADGSYEEHILIPRAGGVKAEAADFNGDGRLDIAVLVSEAREAFYIFVNQGNNEFERHEVFETQPAYGHTYFELQDFDGDGMPDLLVVNGDNVDSDPYNTRKRYHGVRIYLNRGGYNFEQAYFYPLHGAFIGKSADFDNDGDLDIAAISYFPDFSAELRESFVYLENQGGLAFTASTSRELMRGRWMTMDVGDIDADGDVDVMLGGAYLPLGMVAHLDLFAELRKIGPSVLLLENTLH